MQPLPATDAQSLAGQIQVGDQIEIARNDLTDVNFKVSAVSDEGISGNGVFVAYSDIQQVTVRQFSTGATVGLVASIALVLGVTVASSDYQ